MESNKTSKILTTVYNLPYRLCIKVNFLKLIFIESLRANFVNCSNNALLQHQDSTNCFSICIASLCNKGNLHNFYFNKNPIQYGRSKLLSYIINCKLCYRDEVVKLAITFYLILLLQLQSVIFSDIRVGT